MPRGRLGGRLELHRRLRAKPREGRVGQVVDGCSAFRECVDGVDARRGEFRALRQSQPRDEQDIAVLGDLGRAGIALCADGIPRVSPTGGVGPRHPLADQGGEALATVSIHRQYVADVVLADLSVAEDQRDGVGGRDAHLLQLLVVGGELQKRGDLRRPGELAVAHLIATVVGAHDEVGEADERAVEEGGLEDDIRLARECVSGLFDCAGKSCGVTDVWPRNLHDPWPVRLLETGEHRSFVRVAEPAGAREHRIRLHEHSLEPAQFHVEAANERELAVGCGGEVGGASDDGTVEQVHMKSSLMRRVVEQ